MNFIELKKDKFGYNEVCFDAEKCRHYVKINKIEQIWDGSKIYRYIKENKLDMPEHFESQNHYSTYTMLSGNFGYCKSPQDIYPSIYRILIDGKEKLAYSSEVYKYIKEHNLKMPEHLEEEIHQLMDQGLLDGNS